jgi:hypothetical protein
MMSLEDYLVERYYGMFDDKVNAVSRHAEASACAFDHSVQELELLALAAQATYFEMDFCNLTKKHTNVANGFALEPVVLGDLIVTNMPLVVFLPPAKTDMLNVFFVQFYVAFFVAETDWVMKAMKMYPSYVLKDTPWSKLLEACLSMAITFADASETYGERSKEEHQARLLLFVLLATKNVECTRRCGHYRLMGPEHFFPVRDDVRPNAAYFGSILQFPFSYTKAKAGTCDEHEHGWTMYAQTDIAMGQFITVAYNNPFIIVDAEHPARKLPPLSNTSRLAEFKLDSIEKELCGILKKSVSEDHLKRVSTMIMDMALLYNNFDAKLDKRGDAWPASITYAGILLFNILDEHVLRLPPGKNKTAACKVIERYAVPAFSSFQWLSIMVDMYCSMRHRNEYADTVKQIVKTLPFSPDAFIAKCVNASL